jgi:cyclophilin family peptidyl-prolyl cis-trans isomerase
MNRPRAFVIALCSALVVAVVAIAVAVGRANDANMQATAPQPGAPLPSQATPTAAPTIPFANCGKASFSDPLPPVGQPSDIHSYPAAPKMTIDVHKLYLATVKTTKGTISICIEPQLAPVTANNFVTLARNHFYDGLFFHRVVPNFVVQGGDPACTGDTAKLPENDPKKSPCGTGGPGYKFNDEPVRQRYVTGALAMANSGKNTNGSQFFILTADHPELAQSGQYNLFGNVYEGIDVVKSLSNGDVMQKVTVAQQQ